MKKARYVFWVYGLILTIILSACGSPTPVVVVVTATSLPPTEGVIEPTATLVPVNLSGPQSGDKVRWIDGSNLIYIPPGEFVMGNGGFDAPVRNVTLDGFWIYQTKVTNRMFTQCVAVGSCTAPTEELGGPGVQQSRICQSSRGGCNLGSSSSLLRLGQWTIADRSAMGKSGSRPFW
ncbi:SUMF1/EgtB/PvdO family nonheme iron enzyme [Candidatus Villigracilis affinis]|uniref:SUMF1/EgtB/PvdO family nonheme iron enzyme n=1 Tax=Candidatus Villigracilis affinis TaxID=3140682 RepID=UPI0031F13DB2